jgi:hypothetical protein
LEAEDSKHFNRVLIGGLQERTLKGLGALQEKTEGSSVRE